MRTTSSICTAGRREAPGGSRRRGASELLNIAGERGDKTPARVKRKPKGTGCGAPHANAHFKRTLRPCMNNGKAGLHQYAAPWSPKALYRKSQE
jgi:hypothetical protein